MLFIAGCLAMFNAPLDQANPAQRAIECALELDEYSQVFCKEENARGTEFGKTRIGIDTGMAPVGNFGSQE